MCPPFDSAGRKLLVRRQQAAHPLRVGGHLGLRHRWLWLELGFGDLPFAAALAAAAQPAALAAAHPTATRVAVRALVVLRV